jgi:hypothetical protein
MLIDDEWQPGDSSYPTSRKSGMGGLERRLMFFVFVTIGNTDHIDTQWPGKSGAIRPVGARSRSNSRQLKLEAQNQPAVGRGRSMVDGRVHPRFKIEIDISVDSRTCGMLKGCTVDISESGISAMFTLEVPLGEVVELAFTLPFGRVKIYALVRQRNAFRYGFQFMESNFTEEVIRPTCRQLAIEQLLLGDL